VNPDTIGYVWTGELDLNTLRVDGEIFESGKKKLPIKKYPDTCGRGLSFLRDMFISHNFYLLFYANRFVHRFFTLTPDILNLALSLRFTTVLAIGNAILER